MQVEKLSRPVVFMERLVQRIREGLKTETRRVMRPQPPRGFLPWNYNGALVAVFTKGGKSYPEVKGCEHGDVTTHRCPFGVKGDRLWVKEKFRILNCINAEQKVYIEYGDGTTKWVTIEDPETYKKYTGRKTQFKSSRFMPKFAARIFLEVLEPKAERLRDITDRGCEAEGVRPSQDGSGKDWRHDENGWHRTFRQLWDPLNKPRRFGWDDNPWVWVVKFKKL